VGIVVYQVILVAIHKFQSKTSRFKHSFIQFSLGADFPLNPRFSWSNTSQ